MIPNSESVISSLIPFLQADPGKFITAVVKISDGAAKMFADSNDEDDEAKKKKIEKAAQEMMSIVRKLLDAAE